MAIYLRNEQGQFAYLNYPTLKGDKGEKGEKGDRGEQGLPGKNGRDGMTPNLTIGTVTTLEPEQQATVVIGGTKENPVLDFGIPRGADGKDGQGGNEDVPVNTVHYEGETITATNTVNHLVKSATLKGQTLVNLITRADRSHFGSLGTIAPTFNISSNFTSNTMTYPVNNTSKQGALCFKVTQYLQYVYNTDLAGLKGKTFTLMATIENGTNSDINVFLSQNGYNAANGSVVTTISSKTSQTIKAVFMVNDTAYILGHNTILASSPEYCLFKEIMIFEGDYANVDIPYFEGMKSVKSPSVKTTSKNLFDGELELGNIEASNGTNVVSSTRKRSVNYIPVNGNTTYCVSSDKSCEVGVRTYDKKQNYIKSLGVATTFTTPANCKFIRIVVVTVGDVKVQIEKGAIETTYEPHKSNMFSTQKDIVLRSVENTHDTFKLITREYIQRISEVVLNGDEPWSLLDQGTTNTLGFALENYFPLNKSGDKYAKVISDKLPTHKTNLWNQDKVGCVAENNINQNRDHTQLQIRVLKSSLKELTTQGFKNWLKENPITIQFVMDIPLVKMVDLKGQKLYSYKGVTHYDCDAPDGSLVPTLSIDVPTNLPALVSHQRATIQALTVENQEIKAVNEAQDTEIELNQEAINFMLFHSTSMMLSEQTKGTNMMAVYLANQILKGRLDYTLVISRYAEFKDDIDSILNSEGKQELIQ